MENKNQISFERFLYVLKRRFIWILVIAILAAGAAGVATKILVKPEYVSYATFYVQPTEQQANATQQQIAAAKSLVDTYIVLLRGNEFLEKVAEEAGIDYSYIDIRSRMTASSVGGTEVFKVSISDRDPVVAYKIAYTLSEMADEQIKEVQGGVLSRIDKPIPPTEPKSIGLKRNVILAFLLGAVISFAAFFIREILDVTIYTEEDITEYFHYPVIGTIPSIVPSGGQQKSRKSGKPSPKTAAEYGEYVSANSDEKEGEAE